MKQQILKQATGGMKLVKPESKFHEAKKISKKNLTPKEEEQEMSKQTKRSLNLEYLSKMADAWVKGKRADRLAEKGTDAVLDPTYKGPLPTPKKMTRALVIHLAKIQKERIAFGNKIIAFHKAGLPIAPLALNYSMFKVYEDRIKDILRRVAEAHPMWEGFFKGVKGFGPLMTAYVIGSVDIAGFKSPGALIRFCGYGATDGHSDRRKKGEKLKYNPDLKYALWMSSKFMVRMGKKSAYKSVYDEAKLRYQQKFPEVVEAKTADGKVYFLYTKMHIHMMSKRRMVQRLLIDAYKVWRGLEGLPVPPSWEEVEAMKKEVAKTAPGKEGEKEPLKPKRSKTPALTAPQVL